MQDNSFFSKYKYIRALGHGGCGDVFLAENMALGNLWAVKEIAKGKNTSISGYIEPEILKRLNHPALPRICDVYEDGAKIYIVEDYLEGTCLKQELDTKGRFDEQTVIDWAIQLCSVLEYLHCQKPNPIIYGDMKPHNIILTKEGFVKLIDFGVSALVPQENETSNANDTAFIGTKGYAAPEQFIGNGISCASDIYSLGITLIQLVTGIDPLISITLFQNEKYAKYLSPELFELLRRCIHTNSGLRYQSVGILMKELRRYSSRYSIDNENNIGNHNKSLNITKLVAVTGSRGTGVSTMTAAMAEHMARGPTSVCMVDLSISTRLEKSLSVKEKSDSATLIKINSNLYYINLNNLSEKIQFDDLLLHKQLGQLQESFGYIFIDVDITLIKFIEQYVNHIFIVSDMNPFNAEDIGHHLEAEGMVGKCVSRTSFIINKYYKGELGSRNILQSMFLNGDIPQQRQDLLAYAKVFEVPYDQEVYLKWIYSFWGEPLRFKNLLNDGFRQAISKIILNTILPEKSKGSLFTLTRLIHKVGGIGQWAKD